MPTKVLLDTDIGSDIDDAVCPNVSAETAGVRSGWHFDRDG